MLTVYTSTPAAGPVRRPARGARSALNDYSAWFAGDPQLAGSYFGYDGPFPPFNDSLVHHYVFALDAVAVPRLAVEGAFTGAQARAALAGVTLAAATFSGTYTLNRRLLSGSAASPPPSAGSGHSAGGVPRAA